jgi:hypothetical protein
MKTEIISFFSDIDGTSYYSDHAFRLREECFKYNIPYDFRYMESTGDYRLNCLRKPQFILSLLQEKKKPLVWMDIDSVIHKELLAFDHLSENNADIGFAYPIIKQDQIAMSSPKASPIFCNYNEKIIAFLQTWIDRCKESIEQGEHFFDHEKLYSKFHRAYASMTDGKKKYTTSIMENRSYRLFFNDSILVLDYSIFLD